LRSHVGRGRSFACQRDHAVVVDVVANGRADRALDLNRSAGGEHRGRQQRDHVAGAAGQRARRGDRSARARRTARGYRAAPGCRTASRSRTAAGRRTAAGATTQPEKFRQHSGRPQRGHQRRELTAHPAHLGPELAAVPAIAHVASCHTACAHTAVVGQDELFAYLRTCGVPGLARLREPDPRPHEQRLDCGNRDSERAGHVRVCHPPKLAHQERRALLVG